MRTSTKLWLIAAASLVLIGCVILGGVMSMLEWDFTKLSTDRYETNEYAIDEGYKNISITTDTAHIELVPSKSQNTSVVCHESQKIKHIVSVKDNTLVIEAIDTRKWYEYIGINFGKETITVHLPQGEYGALSVKTDTGDVKTPANFVFESIDIAGSTGAITNYASAVGNTKIKMTTGDIHIQSLSADTLDLSVFTGKVTVSDVTCAGDVTVGVSTGKATLANITCKILTTTGNTGDVRLNNVIAADKLSVRRTTGDITFDGCDAAEILAKTDTGDVRGSLLTDKVFVAQTDTGRVNVPDTVTGGRCEISTDTGDIKIEIK